MRNSVISILLFCGLIGLAYSANQYPVRSYPIARGSFVQNWLVGEWNDQQWASELNYMKELEMKYLIIQETVDSKNNTAIYPTRLPGYKHMDKYQDVLELCLRNAQKQGIKVFIGLNFNKDWWKNFANNPQWLYGEMEKGNKVAEEIYKTYFPKYRDTIAGWYWVWEVENLNYKKPQQQEVLAKALDINLVYLHKLTPGLPVMLAPFMNPACGTPQENGQLWDYVITHSSLGKGDIFGPQDCNGTGNLNQESVQVWFREMKKAVAKKPGLKFWSDSETFVSDYSGCTIGRLVNQLKTLAPIVDEIVTFSYNHYQSPNQTDPGYHKTYLEYVKTGKLDSIPPTPVEKIRVTQNEKKEILVSWEPSRDNIGVCGYLIYRNGELIGKLTLPKKLAYTDSQAGQSKKLNYQVVAFDFAGNQSAKSNTISFKGK